MRHAHITQFIVKGSDYFVAHLDNGGVRIGMVGGVCHNFPQAHASRDRLIAIKTEEEAERFFDAFTVYQPNWTNYRVIDQAASITDAMDRYYKHDRLNRPGGTRERLIADRQAEFDSFGFTCIASFHDSVTGRVIYVRQAENGIAVCSDIARH